MIFEEMEKIACLHVLFDVESADALASIIVPKLYLPNLLEIADFKGSIIKEHVFTRGYVDGAIFSCKVEIEGQLLVSSLNLLEIAHIEPDFCLSH